MLKNEDVKVLAIVGSRSFDDEPFLREKIDYLLTFYKNVDTVVFGRRHRRRLLRAKSTPDDWGSKSSPFYPIGKNTAKKRQYLETETSWREVRSGWLFGTRRVGEPKIP